jgi:poly(A)-specific ribonuclease
MALIVQKHLPLIGHYFTFDLIYIYECFLGPLPDTVEEFERELKKHFKYIYDTKLLANEIRKGAERTM